MLTKFIAIIAIGSAIVIGVETFTGVDTRTKQTETEIRFTSAIG